MKGNGADDDLVATHRAWNQIYCPQDIRPRHNVNSGDRGARIVTFFPRNFNLELVFPVR